MRFRKTLYLKKERVFDDSVNEYKTIVSYKPLDTTPRYCVDDLQTLIDAGVSPEDCPLVHMDNFSALSHAEDVLYYNS